MPKTNRTPNSLRRFWLAIVAVMVSALPASATTFTVTNTNDAGAGSLRAAVIAANADATATSASPHIIDMTGIGGTIPLLTALPNLNNHMTFNGPGSSNLMVRRSSAAAGLLRIFAVLSGRTVEINDLRLSYGDQSDGGAIWSAGTLSVNNCLLDSNRGGFNGGGAIFSLGTLSVDRCNFIGNTAAGAPGVLSGGALLAINGGNGTVTNSAFIGNHAIQGGAVAVQGISVAASYSLTNCTFTSNTSNVFGGAAIENVSSGAPSSVSVAYCTFVDNVGPNGAAISNFVNSSTATVTYQNSIFKGNTGTNLYNLNGSMTSLGHNISNDASGNLTATGDMPSTDPKVGPLANNGGPTKTHALLPNSPAIDAGAAISGVTTDQRGMTRVEDLNAFANASGGDGSDIGALETTRWVVNITNDATDATPTGDGIADTDLGTAGNQTSLRAAIEEVNAYGDFDVIEFAIGSTGSVQTIIVTDWYENIISSVYVDGWSQGGSGYMGSPLVELDGSATASTFGLNLQGPKSTVRGLAINNYPIVGFGNGIAIGIFNGGTECWVYGCYFGLAPDGVTRRANGQGGVWNGNGNGNNIIGTNSDGVNDAAERNVFASHVYWGILINTEGNTIAGNYIGTNAAGTAGFGNHGTGIVIHNGAGNMVGGDNASERNVIAGNINGVIITGSSANANRVWGNYIGTDASGATALANSNVGYLVEHGSNNSVVGNVISGNGAAAVHVRTNASGTTVAGNRIGTDAAGTSAMGNGGNGVYLLSGANNTRIGSNNDGSNDAAEGNTIAYNANGVVAASDAGTGNRVNGNSIHDNTGLGIDLGANGTTANDAGDGDIGPNRLQNFPEITSTHLVAGGDLQVNFAVPSTAANSSYPLRVEVFVSDGSAEGKTFLGSAVYSTAGALMTTTFTPAGPVNVGDEIVLTATDNTGNTSEFSAEATVITTITSHPQEMTVCAPSPVTLQVTATGTGLSYQWRRNGEDLVDGGSISGATTSTLTIDPSAASNSGSYDVVVNGITSNPATVTVNEAPVVTLDPVSNPAVCAGEDVTFTSSASGVPAPTVQWQVSTDNGTTWNDVPGATGDTLTLTDVTSAMDGDLYQAVYTNSCSADTSAVATLSVHPAPTLSVSLSPNVLWPPNNKMRDITATVTVNGCNALSVVLESITCDESNGANAYEGASFNTTPTDVAFRLRAQRDGSGDGRVYTVRYMITYDAGNGETGTAYATATVVVPHDQSSKLATSGAIETGMGITLGQNAPNPFTNATTIPFRTTASGHVVMKVYTMEGVEVATLVDGDVTKGEHQAIWDGTARDGKRVPSGTYIYRITVGDEVVSKSMVVVR